MRFIVFLSFILTFQFCLSQNEKSKKGIKKIVSVEILKLSNSNGEPYNLTRETNETSFDVHGKKLKHIKTYYRNSEPIDTNTTTYHYNSDNKIDYTISFIEKDSTTFKTYYDYNDSLLVKMHFDYTKNEIRYKFEETYSYNADNKLISSNYIYFKKSIDSDMADPISYINIKERYDKKQRTYEMDYTESDSSYRNNIYKYKWRRNNVLLNEKEYNKAGKLINKTVYKYSFDDKNHWIIREAYKNKSLYKTTYRDIEYYN